MMTNYSITPSPVGGKSLHETFDITEDQYHQFNAAKGKGYGILPMLICTIQTDTLENLCADLFLPTFIHVASKTNLVSGRFLIQLAALFLDLLTLPIRLLTLIPRIAIGLIYQKETHPLYQFIQKHSKHPEIYREADPIYLTIIIRALDKCLFSRNLYYFGPKPDPIDAGLKFI